MDTQQMASIAESWEEIARFYADRANEMRTEVLALREYLAIRGLESDFESWLNGNQI